MNHIDQLLKNSAFYSLTKQIRLVYYLFYGVSAIIALSNFLNAAGIVFDRIFGPLFLPSCSTLHWLALLSPAC